MVSRVKGAADDWVLQRKDGRIGQIAARGDERPRDACREGTRPAFGLDHVVAGRSQLTNGLPATHKIV